MDVHRCRFVPYVPQSINALAFSHTSNLKQETPVDLRLAIGRANGDIELWSPLRSNWFQEKILHGSTERTIEQLAWTQDLIVDEKESSDTNVEHGSLRLFSSGGSSSLTEWDLAKGIPKRHAQGNVGDIWCIAPQPQWNSTPRMKGPSSQVAASPCQRIAAGCSDGTVLLFTTADDDLRYERIVAQPPKKKSRVISLAWRDRNTIVIGYEASTIRVIDIRNRQVIRDLSLGKPADGNNCVVWALTCLADGTIISGDSSGELKIWDSRNLSLVQRLKTHEADILDVTTSEGGDIIYSCGVDRRTVAYRPTSAQADPKNRRWQQFVHRRFHQHDVKVITSYQSKDLSVAISGGIDAVPIVIPLHGMDSEYHRTLSHLPQKPQMSLSAKARLLLTWWSKDLYLWSIPDALPNNIGEKCLGAHGNDRRLLAKLQLSGEESLTSAEISESGDMIVAATSSSVKLFQVRERTLGDLREIRSRQIDLPTNMRSFGATSVGFSPDEKWIFAVRLSNELTLSRILRPNEPNEKPKIGDRVVKLDRQSFKHVHSFPNSLGDYMRSITNVAFSSDSRILAVGDISGKINTWILEGHENLEDETSYDEEKSASSSDSSSDYDSDSDDETNSVVTHGQKWIKPPNGSQLPTLDSAILRLTFKPSLDASVINDKGDGNIGLHPTRHTPHPVSHELPSSSSAHLVAVTSTHQLFEFNILSCRLTNWSRRNPPSILPSDFKIIKDRIMGSWWDCNSVLGYERLWMYGASWIYMLDLARDLDTMLSRQEQMVERIGAYSVVNTASKIGSAIENKQKKVKTGRKRKRGTGAGDELKTLNTDNAKKRGAKVNGLMKPVSGDEGKEYPGLMPLTKQNDIEGVEFVNAEDQATLSPSRWNTFRYRSIFGAGSLGVHDQSGDIDGISRTYPNVVIVERPTYDIIEMMPRFAGGQDWG